MAGSFATRLQSGVQVVRMSQLLILFTKLLGNAQAHETSSRASRGREVAGADLAGQVARVASAQQK